MFYYVKKKKMACVWTTARVLAEVNHQWSNHWHSLGLKFKKDSDQKQHDLGRTKDIRQLWVLSEKARLKKKKKTKIINQYWIPKSRLRQF